MNRESKNLPQNWVEVNLGALFDWSNGEGLTRKKMGHGEYLVYGGNGVVGAHDKFLTDKESIVIGRVGAHCGNVNIAKPKSWVTDNAIYSRWNSNCINLKFALYLLTYSKLNELAGGSGQPYVSQQILNNFKIVIPSIPIQHRIVSRLEELFSKLDAGIEYLRKTQVLLKQYRHSVLKYAFEGKLTEKWRGKNIDKIKPASLLLELIEEQKRRTQPVKGFQLGSIPSIWTWINLDNVDTFIGSGITPRGGRSVYTESGVPFIRSQNVHPDGLHLDDVVYVTQGLHDKMSRTHVKPGDVLLNITGASIGRSTVVPDTFQEANVNQHVCIIRTNKIIRPAFLSYWLNSPFMQTVIFNINKGVTRQGLNYSHIRSMPLPLVCVEEQEEIIKQIESNFSIIKHNITSIQNSLRQSRKLRQSILKSAFEGKLVPEEPDEEPAHILLQKINNQSNRPYKIKRNERNNFKQMRLI